MGAMKQTLIYCDGENCPHDGPYNPDYEAGSAARQRQQYRQDGWRYINGKDYCPECVAKLQSSKGGR